MTKKRSTNLIRLILISKIYCVLIFNITVEHNKFNDIKNHN